MAANAGLALLAGLLSTLSPCVLPLLPLVLGAASAEHRYGPLALVAGLAISFTSIGLFVATIGFAIGLDTDVFRAVSAVIFIILGMVLILPALQARIAFAGGPVSNWAEQRLTSFSTSGIAGQFAVGLLLGAVWVPCVGPTLGAASLLAAQGKDLAGVTLTMLAFGIGAATPLALLGFISREAISRWRKRMGAVSYGVRLAFAAMLIFAGALILSGFDKTVEATLVEASPAWLIDLTTRF